MYNKNTIEHQADPVEEVIAIKHAWADIKSDAYRSDTIEELESLLIEAPLYSIWSALIRREPLLIFEEMRDIAFALGKEINRVADELMQYSY